MARGIFMYLRPNPYPMLQQIEGGDITFDIDLKDDAEKRKYVKSYYIKLGPTFEKRFEAIRKKLDDPEQSKTPFFWDCPEIKFIAKDDARA